MPFSDDHPAVSRGAQVQARFHRARWLDEPIFPALGASAAALATGELLGGLLPHAAVTAAQFVALLVAAPLTWLGLHAARVTWAERSAAR